MIKISKKAKEKEETKPTGNELDVKSMNMKHEAFVREFFYDHPPSVLPEFDLEKLVRSPNDPELIELDKLFVALGKRRSGKTFTWTWIMCQYLPKLRAMFYELFPKALVITATKFNGYWQRFFPDKYIHKDLDVLNTFMPYREDWIAKWKSDKKRSDPTSEEYEPPWVMLCLDDMAGAEDFHSSEMVRQISVKGRHYKLFTWLTTQYINLISPTVRENVDVMQIMYQSTFKSKETIAEYFFSNVKKWEAIKWLDDHTFVDEDTNERNNLLFNNMPLTGELEKKCFTINPEKIDFDFCVGSKSMWKDQMETYMEFKDREGALRNQMKRAYYKKHPKQKPEIKF
jgi:hypothetical protein